MRRHRQRPRGQTRRRCKGGRGGPVRLAEMRCLSVIVQRLSGTRTGDLGATRGETGQPVVRIVPSLQSCAKGMASVMVAVSATLPALAEFTCGLSVQLAVTDGVTVERMRLEKSLAVASGFALPYASQLIGSMSVSLGNLPVMIGQQ